MKPILALLAAVLIAGCSASPTGPTRHADTKAHASGYSIVTGLPCEPSPDDPDCV